MKETRAVGNYIRIAPRKARVVIDLIRGRGVSEAIGVLHLCRKKAAKPIGKVLLSAMANATANDKADPDKLVVARAWVDEGPTLRRYMARAMGRATIIRKRTSRITIHLAQQERAEAKSSAAPKKAAPVKAKEAKESAGRKTDKVHRGLFSRRRKKEKRQ
jgi:large subunit ribosomal protein L22